MLHGEVLKSLMLGIGEMLAEETISHGQRTNISPLIVDLAGLKVPLHLSLTESTSPETTLTLPCPSLLKSSLTAVLVVTATVVINSVSGNTLLRSVSPRKPAKTTKPRTPEEKIVKPFKSAKTVFLPPLLRVKKEPAQLLKSTQFGRSLSTMVSLVLRILRLLSMLMALLLAVWMSLINLRSTLVVSTLNKSCSLPPIILCPSLVGEILNKVNPIGSLETVGEAIGVNGDTLELRCTPKILVLNKIALMVSQSSVNEKERDLRRRKEYLNE
mmetsp:Transcript_36833/g.33064  ORF Transcript_36833/g.33064 Transcript_36833/m.33064 type:complete len:271 (+) Transcript_36833:1104-1916(+)